VKEGEEVVIRQEGGGEGEGKGGRKGV